MKFINTTPSTKSDALLQLIKSMSKAEKRAFSIYVQRGSNSADNTFYYNVFMEINKRKRFDDDQLVKQIPGLKRSQLPNIRANLYNQILSCLRNLYSKKEVFGLLEGFDFARILYDKGLYIQSLDQLQKIKLRAIDLQEFFILSDIIQFEKFIESQYITSSVGDRASNLSKESEHYFEKTHHINVLSNKALHLYDWYLKYGYIKNIEEKELVQKFFYRDFVDLDVTTASFYELIFYHQCYMWYYYIIQDFQNYYRHCLKFVDAFDTYPQMKSIKVPIYMKAMHNLCNALFFLDSYDRYNARFKMFEEIKPMIKSDKANLEGLYFLYFYLHKIDLHILEGTFQKSWRWVDELIDLVTLNPYNWDVHRLMVFYYKIACLFFGGGDYNRTIDFLNLIINHKSYDVRVDIQSYARILNLIAHYELGNQRLLQYQVKSVYRFLGKMEELQKVHQFIFSFLRKLPTMKLMEVKDHFKQLKMDLQYLENDPIENRFFLYLDIISWLESKIQNRSVESIIHEKFNKKVH